MRVRPGQLVALALFVVWVSWALAVYDSLPARIPVHFGAGGVPDGFSNRSLGSWMMLPMIGAAMAVFLPGVVALTRRTPSLANVPEKDRFLKLSTPDQARVLAIVADRMAWILASLMVLLGTLHFASWRVAVGRAESLGLLGYAGLAVGIIIPVGLALSTNRRLKARILELSTAV